ncbi:MAG: GNAT family N-acetyltransferase [Bacillota bacterium]
MLEVMGLDNETLWADTVKQFQQHDVYYLPQYVKAFKLHGDGEPMLFYYASGNTRAINVVMKRDISQCAYFTDSFQADTCFDLSTPYGYGGFLIEGGRDAGALKALDEEYSAWCRSYGIVSEFVRFHPVLENHRGMEPVYDVAVLGKTVSMDLSSPEVIHANIKTNKRNRINKAQKSGVEVSWGLDESLFTVFKEIYDETMDRNEAQRYYYFEKSFYESVLVDLNNNALVFYATLSGEIIAAAIFLFCNGQMHCHLSATKKEYLPNSPVTLLNYKAALWGFENGYRTLHLGGGVGGRTDSLYTYKHEMNMKSDNVFAVGRKIFDCERYEFLMDMRRKNGAALNPDFFPQYRG